jgi:hypothetical protein
MGMSRHPIFAKTRRSISDDVEEAAGTVTRCQRSALKPDTPSYDGVKPFTDGRFLRPASIATSSRFSAGGSGHVVYGE